MSGKRLWLLAGIVLLLTACGGQPSGGNGGGGGGGGSSEGQPFALLHEGLGTKALAVVSDQSPVSTQVAKKASYLYIAGFRQGTYQEGLQDAMVWMVDGQGRVVARKRIGSEMMPGYSPDWARSNDRAYALALHRVYLYVAGYLSGCDDDLQDTCEGNPFVAKLNPADLSYVTAFGGNSRPGFGEPGVAVLDQVADERTYAYALAVGEAGVYVGGFGGTRGFVAVLDPDTGREERRLLLGSPDPQAKTHVEALAVRGGALYVAGHTNVVFDCQGAPMWSVEEYTMAFVLKLSASDLSCDPGFGPGGVFFVEGSGTEILSLTLTQDGAYLLAGGFSGHLFCEGDICLDFMGLARGWVLDPSTGQLVGFFPGFPNAYLYGGFPNANCRQEQHHIFICADRIRSVRLASDGTVLLAGHVKGQAQAQDRFPGTEDGLTGSNLFFARFGWDGTLLDYQEQDFGGGTELGFGVVQGPDGYFYVVGSTTGPVGGYTDQNPKAIVLRFGP